MKGDFTIQKGLYKKPKLTKHGDIEVITRGSGKADDDTGAGFEES